MCGIGGVPALYMGCGDQPGIPEFGFFDGVTDPLNRTLYVSFTGRGVQRLDPILPRPSSEPRIFTLMEIAAMLGEA